jgi:hypothetical protein
LALFLVRLLREGQRAVGLLSRRVAWAARGIVNLAESAHSEAVRLSALRAIYA